MPDHAPRRTDRTLGRYWCGVGKKAARRNLDNLIERDPLINEHHRDVFPHWIQNLLI